MKCINVLFEILTDLLFNSIIAFLFIYYSVCLFIYFFVFKILYAREEKKNLNQFVINRSQKYQSSTAYNKNQCKANLNNFQLLKR